MLCAIYCRLSREDADKAQESESIQNQKAILIEYAEQRGWDIYHIYVDEDYSGADSQRPAWRAMLRDAESAMFRVILCKTQSRFTRDMEMVEKYIHGYFPVWGIRFVALLDNVDTDVRGNKKARQINGLVNEWYLEDLSENIRAVLDRKRREGKFVGSRAPYGYAKDPADHNRLLVDSESAAVVRQVFGMYLTGMGIHCIAEELNARGIPPPGGHMRGGAGTGRWSHTAVGRILKNERYIGIMVQGTRRRQSYKSTRMEAVPEEEWVRIESAHEAIVDRKTFAAVRQTLRGRARSDGSGKPHPLGGMVYCADCGCAMHRISHRYKGNVNAYLQCGLYAKTRKAPQCTRHSIRLDKLTEAVAARVHAYIRTCNLERIPDLRALAEHPPDETARETVRLRNRLDKLDTATLSLYMDRVDGLLTGEQFAVLSRSMLKEGEEIARQLAALERLGERSREEAKPFAAGSVREWLLEQPLDHEMASLLIGRVEVHEADSRNTQVIEIQWKI